MSNIKQIRRQPIAIKMNGEEKHLRFTLNAMALLEEKFGTVDAAIKKAEEGSIIVVRYILWAGLQFENPEMTEIEVGNSIDIFDLKELVNKITEGLTNDLPDAETAKNQPANQTK